MATGWCYKAEYECKPAKPYEPAGSHSKGEVQIGLSRTSTSRDKEKTGCVRPWFWWPRCFSSYMVGPRGFVRGCGPGGGAVRASGRRAVGLVVVAVLVGSALGPAPGVVASRGFSDVEGTTHEKAIRALEAAGVFEGTECRPGEFCPRDAVERWVMGVWLVRILDGRDPPTVGTSRFVDVDAAKWWAPYVDRLADLGVTAGCATEPARFCPYETVTRAQMATFLVIAFQLPSGAPAGFADVEGGAHAAHIDALAASGITSGCSTQPFRYCPRRDTTRAEMATFLLRAQAGTASVTSAEKITRAHNVIVRVVVVDPGWHGFDVRGGWPAAVPVRESESLKYFEVAVWEERGAIHFYEFDNRFDPFGWDSPVATVTAKRERYVVQRDVGLPEPWSPERSTFIRQAFATFTSELASRYPESAHHLVYQGHGSPGGALFQGQLSYEDASTMLAHWTGELGYRLGVIDMGGPCNKGSFTDLENFCSYSQYYIASDLPNGGFMLDDWTADKIDSSNPDKQYHRLLSDSSNLQEALIGRIDLAQRLYGYARQNMIDSKIEQANYLYSCREFSDFVVAFRTFLKTTNAGYDSSEDLYMFMLHHDAPQELLQAFKRVIIHQADNKDFFDWKEEANGMLMPQD